MHDIGVEDMNINHDTELYATMSLSISDDGRVIFITAQIFFSVAPWNLEIVSSSQRLIEMPLKLHTFVESGRESLVKVANSIISNFTSINIHWAVNIYIWKRLTINQNLLWWINGRFRGWWTSWARALVERVIVDAIRNVSIERLRRWRDLMRWRRRWKIEISRGQFHDSIFEHLYHYD